MYSGPATLRLAHCNRCYWEDATNTNVLCRGEEQQRFKDPKEQIQDTGLPNESVPNTQPTKKCSVVTEGEHPRDSVKLPTGHVHLMESPPPSHY